MSALKGMFSFFTMMRLDITQGDMDDMDKQFWMIPAVGAFYGLMAAFLMTVLTHYTHHPLMSAVITFFVIFSVNRFLHIDGTIDFGDGVVVAGTREDHLRALKDPKIGAGGMAFALMVILMSITMASSIWPFAFIALLLFSAEVMVKVGMVSAAAFWTPGDGMAGNSVRNTNTISLLFAVITAAVLISVAALFVYLMGEHTSLPVALPDHHLILLPAAGIVSIITGWVMSRIAKRNFGYVNGDVLGATNEITRATVLLTFLILLAVI